ncbi:MAG: anthranilate synthase component I, partial [archaeon]|nr:anthranilate synthase component I [archaeon]
MLKPTVEELRAYAAEGYTICPVCLEILSDFRTPIEVMRALMNVDEHCFMLESADATKRWGRYTFLGYDPKLLITVLNGRMRIGDREFETDDPDSHIREILKAYRTPKVPGFPSFTGGLVGYFSYDYLKYAEPTLRLDAEDTEGFQDIDLMLFDKVIVFDNFAQKMLIIVNVPLDDIESNYDAAQTELLRIKELVKHGAPRADLHGRMTSEIKPHFEKERFCEMIDKAKRHIFEGDIFQIVLSNRLEADFDGSLFNTYR